MGERVISVRQYRCRPNVTIDIEVEDTLVKVGTSVYSLGHGYVSATNARKLANALLRAADMADDMRQYHRERKWS